MGIKKSEGRKPELGPVKLDIPFTIERSPQGVDELWVEVPCINASPQLGEAYRFIKDVAGLDDMEIEEVAILVNKLTIRRYVVDRLQL